MIKFLKIILIVIVVSTIIFLLYKISSGVHIQGSDCAQVKYREPTILEKIFKIKCW